METLKYYLCKLLTWPCRGSDNLNLYERLCALNEELAHEVEKRLKAERELAACNRLLLAHNAKLRELLQHQVWINDTSGMLAELNQMVYDMRFMIDVAAAAYEKTPEDSL